MNKSAVISIIGRPSAGKSTLLNTLCGEKISITAPSPQTTWNAIRGIYTSSSGQLIFIDTPGYHQSDKNLNKRLQSVALSTIGDSDIILYVIDSTRPPGPEEQEIADVLAGSALPIIAAINKADHARARTAPAEAFVRKALPNAAIAIVSATAGKGLEELIQELFRLAPEGESLYPDDFYTDQPPEFRIAEIIRECAVNRVTQELPHAIYVEIADLEIDSRTNRLWIRAFLIVERESQKGILVGKGGVGIKAIRQTAQKEISRLFPNTIHLDLRVKTRDKWRSKDQILSRLIY